MFGGKLVARGDLAALGERLRAEGRKVVFTNGCFDVLHVGHARYLEERGRWGTCWWSGLNTDSWVRGLKGPLRRSCPEMSARSCWQPWTPSTS